MTWCTIEQESRDEGVSVRKPTYLTTGLVDLCLLWFYLKRYTPIILLKWQFSSSIERQDVLQYWSWSDKVWRRVWKNHLFKSWNKPYINCLNVSFVSIKYTSQHMHLYPLSYKTSICNVVVKGLRNDTDFNCNQYVLFFGS